jgi:nanoRNase/pAp phosphatase (c-di-AMP/oligoRNAs hydrolase)
MQYFDAMLQNAPLLLRAKKLQIQGALRGGAARQLKVGENSYSAFVCNSDTHISDLGNAAILMKDDSGQPLYDLALMWSWKEKKREFSVSLRSFNESPADVSKIAAHFGGGGHRNAAGFTSRDLEFLKFTEFPKG